MIYGCIGEKLSHSFSKEIHNKLFDYSYELCEVEKDKLKEFMLKKDFKAINVTIPYKSDVIPFLDEISDTAKAIGAVNTIVNDNGILKGYNTDFSGICALLDKNSISVLGKKILILGSGGTSKTAKAVCQSLKAKEIFIVSRKKTDDTITYDEAKTLHSDAQIIINTTPVGMYPNITNSPIELDVFSNLEAVVDAIYNPLCSKLVCDAKNKGTKAVGGLYMLVAQAVFAAEKFVNQNIEKEKIDSVYLDILKQKQNIALIGMPSSGKTTVGKIISEILGKTFVDIDVLIKEKAGIEIPEIFEKYGERYFRSLESDVICKAAMLQNCVIATGGGAVLDKNNIYNLNKNSKIFFLDRPLDSLIPTNDRPLSSNRETLKKLFSERYDIYCDSCDYHITDMGSAIENANKIIEVFKNETACN